MQFDPSRIQKKRFIAAAVCPRCQSVDTVYTFHYDDTLWRACVDCDFSERYSDQTGNMPEELVTRVNQPRLNEPILAHETPIETVKIIKPKS